MLRLRDRLEHDHHGFARAQHPLMRARAVRDVAALGEMTALGDMTATGDGANAFGAFVPGARCIREATASGRLDGLTFAVKDLIDVAGVHTGGGNPHWLADQAAAVTSAPVVEAALAQGARLVGKAVTDELAFSLEGENAHYGTPINPACPERLPGGSSSGSAVAVAAGLADFALGTDTGGSVRVPASFTGVFGFRPTHGRVSAQGVVKFAPSYDTVGWFAREADVLYRVGETLLDGAGDVPVRRLVLVRDAFAMAEAEGAALLEAEARRWGAAEETAVFDGAQADWLECYRVLQGAEIWQHLGPWITARRPAFGASIAPRFTDAATIEPPAVERYRRFRRGVTERLHHLTRDGAALVIPTTPGRALAKGASAAEISSFYATALPLNAIAGHAGLPQVTLPVTGIEGCPLGLSIVGPRGADRALLKLAETLEHSFVGDRFMGDARRG
jgi:amidase